MALKTGTIVIVLAALCATIPVMAGAQTYVVRRILVDVDVR